MSEAVPLSASAKMQLARLRAVTELVGQPAVQLMTADEAERAGLIELVQAGLVSVPAEAGSDFTAKPTYYSVSPSGLNYPVQVTGPPSQIDMKGMTIPINDIKTVAMAKLVAKGFIDMIDRDKHGDTPHQAYRPGPLLTLTALRPIFSAMYALATEVETLKADLKRTHVSDRDQPAAAPAT